MAFELMPLPYDKTAFGKTISAETFDFHHGKHHKTYIDKTNAALGQAGLEDASLSDVIRTAKSKSDKELFNNASQAWNHNFYWHCLSPDKQEPSAALEAKLDDAFGSTDAFLKAFKEEAVKHFASGWAWLVLDGGKLKITSLHDGDSPPANDGMKPLLTIDVWEHAYYLDYRNERPKYVDALLGKAIDWAFVERNLDGKGVGRADQEAGAAVKAKVKSDA